MKLYFPRQFGIQTVQIKPILKQLTIIFGHADKNVRAEGVQLVNEIYRFLGAAIDPFLADLKPVQVKELNEGFQALNEQGQGAGKGQQTRFTRDQLRQKAIKEAEQTLRGGNPQDADSDHVADEPTSVDPSEFAEPVAILDKLPPAFYENLASSKWKERKEEALDPLLSVVSVPKISDKADYSELLRALAGKMTDANVACVIVAAQCIDCIAKGLRNQFDAYKAIVIAPLLERLKEKKQTVVDALASALDSVAQSCSISDLVEDLQTFSKHKNPQVKSETFRWLVRCLSTTRNAPSPSDVKALAGILLPALEDGFEPVRAAAQQGMGTMMKIIGERAMNPYMQNMDELRRTKVMEFFEKAEVKCKAGTGPSAPVKAPSAAPSTKPAAKKAEGKPVATMKAEPSGRASPAISEASHTVKLASKPAVRPVSATLL